MKKHYLKLKALAIALVFATSAFAGGNAFVQIIHNSPDPLVANVDLWIDGGFGQQLLESNFAYLEATTYRNINSSSFFKVYLKTPGSSANDVAIDSITTATLTTGYYQLIISGVKGTGYAANPNGRPTGLQLGRLDGSRTTGTAAPLVDVIAFHGVTDAPGIDVRVRSGGPLLVNNLKFGDYAPSYLQVPATWYQLEVIVEDSSAVVNTWIANVSALAGQAATVFASGFLTPSANNNGPGIGLYAALANGTVIPLPVRKTANVQLIHNAADPALDTINVYVNTALGFPKLPFRGATPFIPITADFPIQLGIVSKTGTSWADTVKTWTFFFEPDSNYVAMATGVVNPANFAANPDAVATNLDIVVKQGAVIANGSGTNVSFNFANGVTDVYGLDARIRSNGPLLFNNVAFKDAESYLQAPAYYYAWELLKQDSSLAVINAWILNLSSYAGSGIYIFSSGFLTPSANGNGPALDLFGALPSGQVIAFPRRQTASVQFIHNCADPIADTMDVYINGAKYFGDFVYRNASPVLGIMTANFPIDIAMAPNGSTSVNDTFWHEVRFFSPGQVYIGVAQGNVGNGMAANPDAVDNSFNLYIQNPGQISAGVNTNFDYYFIHGAPDAQSVDIKTMGGNVLFNDVSYGEQTDYEATVPSNSVLQVQDITGATTFASYEANFVNRAGQAGVLLASGYLNPSANNNGAPFGLYLVTAGGGPFVALPLYNSITDLNSEIGLTMYPNPTTGTLFINFTMQNAERVTIEITDINGKVVKSVLNETVSGNQNIAVDMNDVSNGMYFARVTSAQKTSNNKFTLVK
ncbi:MAG TPA: T9SS type A sorting domain-containing protein [Chitinophagales bacterium]|nr:T9SS type A sorting domain-containing protein [Chitinophagales bacterium]